MSYQAIAAVPAAAVSTGVQQPSPPAIGDSSGSAVKSCADFIIRNKNCFTLTGIGIWYVTAGILVLEGHYRNMACQIYTSCEKSPDLVGFCGDDPCPTAHADLAIGIMMIVLPIIGAAGVLLKAKYSR